MKFKRQEGMLNAIVIESQEDLDCVYKYFKIAVDYHLTSSSKKDLFLTRHAGDRSFKRIANGEEFAETYVSSDGVLYNIYSNNENGNVEVEMYKVVVKNVKDWDISNMQCVCRCLQSEWGENSTSYVMNLATGYTGDISELDMANIYSVSYLKGMLSGAHISNDMYGCYDFTCAFEWLLRCEVEDEAFNRGCV